VTIANVNGVFGVCTDEGSLVCLNVMRGNAVTLAQTA
jgi:hypothetical protein